MSDLHPAAAGGFSAGAETYARGRPDYPAALSAWLRETLRLEPGRSVADLGAGTGKFTRLLATTGADVTAIEPVDAMRAQLAASLPGVTARPGSAEAMPLADASLDALVCAQAFHWFSTKAALAEIRRFSRSGAASAWSGTSATTAQPWVAELTTIMNAHEGDAPRYHTGVWRGCFRPRASGPCTRRRFRTAIPARPSR